MQKVEINGQEVEVYTAAEHTAAVDAAKTAAEGEWKPKLAQVEKELTDTKKHLGERTTEFGQFRKLSDEAVKDLSVAQRTIYENQLSLAEKDKQIADRDKIVFDSVRDAAIRARTAGNQPLFDKVKEMYSLIGLDETTPEQVNARVLAALGAIGQTAPDLIAAAGLGGGGAYVPPTREKDKKSFADSDRGKEIANDLGITLEIPKK